ncbi:MAG: site-specific integrase [Clostridia bacterium]|nr:site-specific integrase [Clostridia bacterium]
MSKHRPNGDGMIRNRGKIWEGRIVVGHKSDQSPIYKYIYGKTQKELIEKMHQLHIKYNDVELNENSNLKLSEWLDIWIEKYAKHKIKFQTYESYIRTINLHIKPYIGNKKMSKLTSNDIQLLYATLKKEGRINYDAEYGKQLSNSSVQIVHRVLRVALEDAVKKGCIHQNPARFTTPPKRNKVEIKILNEEELSRFMEVVNQEPFWSDLFYLEMTTGLRVGELCGLKWSDFDEKSKTLIISRTIYFRGGELIEGDTKTRNGNRIIYLPESTYQVLKSRSLNINSQWIFPNMLDNNKPINPRSAYMTMKKLLDKANCPNIRFHDLRHTFATHAISSGVDVKTLSNILGHSKSSFTLDTYTHVTTEMQKNAAEKVESMLGDMFGLDVMSL